MTDDNRVVLDIETQKTFDEVGGREHLDKLGVSVVGVYHYGKNEYMVYQEHELGQLQNLLIDSSLVIGFNHIWFDLPVLQSYFSIDVKKLPVLDIMQEAQTVLGHRIGLDAIAKATLNVGKTGHGLDAIRYYREGKIQELKDYCLNDVKVTREVFDFGMKNGKLFYLSKLGQQKKEFKVSWKEYKKPIRENNPAEPSQYKLF